MKKKNIIFTLIIFLIIIIDRVVKELITRNITLNKVIKVFYNIFYITNVHNDGAAFSILNGKRIFLILLSVCFLVFIIYYIFKNKDYYYSFSLIIGGLLGNLIDRVIFGYVIDYIGINIFKYSFPIFNIADICIVIGAFLLLIRKDKKIVGDKHEINS